MVKLKVAFINNGLNRCFTIPTFIAASYMKAYSECQEFFKQQAGLGKSEESNQRIKEEDIDYGNDVSERKIDDDVCKIVLYSRQNFQGNSQVFVEKTVGIKAMERSMRTIGSCCWKIVR